MTENSEYVRFDWAIKRILRDKANKEVLEGLITVLLGEAVEITEILESEGNQAAREKLAYMSMTPKQRRAYEDYMISVHAARDAW